MNDTKRANTNKRITYTATDEGIKRAEKALKRLFGSKTNLSEPGYISRSTVTNFFSRKPIELDSFQKICEKLTLNWREIAALPREESLEISEIEQNENSKNHTNENCNSSALIKRLEKEQESFDLTMEKDQVSFAISGTIDKKDLTKLKSLIQLARKLAKDDLIDFIDIQEGSIKLILKGSRSGLERLEQLFHSGELTKIFKQELNITVEDVSIIDTQTSINYQGNEANKSTKKQLALTIAGDLSQADRDILKAALIKSSVDDKEIKNQKKFRLIKEIKNNFVKNKNLIHAYLSREIVGRIQQQIMNPLRGKCIQILGLPQSGKSTIYNQITSRSIEADATSLFSKSYYQKKTKTKLKILKNVDLSPGFLKQPIECSSNFFSKWKEKIIKTNPDGIIYTVDSCTFYANQLEKEQKRFEDEVRGLYEIGIALKQIEKPKICILLILVNKIDLIDNSERIVDQYRRKLFDHQIVDNKKSKLSLKNFLQTVLGTTVPIRVEPFCADKNMRSNLNYQRDNLELIEQFYIDLQGRRGVIENR